MIGTHEEGYVSPDAADQRRNDAPDLVVAAQDAQHDSDGRRDHGPADDRVDSAQRGLQARGCGGATAPQTFEGGRDQGGVEEDAGEGRREQEQDAQHVVAGGKGGARLLIGDRVDAVQGARGRSDYEKDCRYRQDGGGGENREQQKLAVFLEGPSSSCP